MEIVGLRRNVRLTLVTGLLTCIHSGLVVAQDVFLGKFASDTKEFPKLQPPDRLEIYVTRKGENYIVTEFDLGKFKVDYEARDCRPEREIYALEPAPGDVRALCQSRSGFLAFVYSQNGIKDPMARIYREQGAENPRKDPYLRAQFYYKSVLGFRKIESFSYAPNAPEKLLTHETPEFLALCRESGTRLMGKPTALVRSIAYDWDSKLISGWPHVDRVEVDSEGRIGVIGGFPKSGTVEAQKKVAFEYRESRRDSGRSGAATKNPAAPYYHFPENAKEPYYGVESLSADAVAFLEVDKPDELRKAPINQGAIRYRITLTDRRSGVVLGVQTFVVDQVNHRACGANVDNAISQAAFFFDAINR